MNNKSPLRAVCAIGTSAPLSSGSVHVVDAWQLSVEILSLDSSMFSLSSVLLSTEGSTTSLRSSVKVRQFDR
jgi:hypothetical protein